MKRERTVLTERPQRLAIPDFAGRMRSMPDEASAWECLKKPEQPSGLILLGVGPGNPAKLPFVQEAEKKGIPVYWLESGMMLPHVNMRHFNWPEIDANELGSVSQNAEVYFYKPGMGIAPDFWGPVLAALASGCHAFKKAEGKAAWLPGDNSLLLHQELLGALKAKDFQQIFEAVPASSDISSLDRTWQGVKPDFALSVNFRGLDPQGRIFELCDRLQIPLAIWLVDNPWNLLGAIALPWWRRARIFVTDASFIEPLKNNGALNVEFCPLACATHMWRPVQSSPGRPPLFVGRSAFPDRLKFFSGLKIPDDLKEKAERMLAANILPDYHWWALQIGAVPWPGLAARKIALGADEFSAVNRARWLQAAVPYGLEIIGDAGWQKFFPGLSIAPPVDYYGKLPACYEQALCVLNITSLLLPGSLNQRHFDVWASGGFMIGEYTPGLELFPKELTEPVTVENTAELPEKLAWLRHSPKEKRELQEAWREMLQKSHTYQDRIQYMLDRTGGAS